MNQNTKQTKSTNQSKGVTLTFGDGVQVSILKNNWQGADIPIQISTFYWEWRQREEIAGGFDRVSHLLVTVSTNRQEREEKMEEEEETNTLPAIQYITVKVKTSATY